MQIFLYEFVTGGGGFSTPGPWPPSESLLREGQAMLSAVASDLGRLPGVRVAALRDTRCSGLGHCQIKQQTVASARDERAAFAALASAADWTLVIAPEIGGALIERCQWVRAAGGRLLGPGPQAMEVACDKHATADWLNGRSIATPLGISLDALAPLPLDFAYPAVLKPRDGAGSLGVQLVTAEQARHTTTGPGAWRLEAYHAGTPASVALLCGPRGMFPLVPARQRLSDDCSFSYLGGALPLSQPLADRATQLAVKAVGSLPQALGYLGVDLVLGDDPGGREDVAIEINPRLTTSYVGLRALASGNLAAAMLAVADGRKPDLAWYPRTVEFDSDGRWRELTAGG